MSRLPGVPYWRLSGFYFAHFATVGALVPYIGLYYKHLGFSAAQIGELNGMLIIGRVVAPLLWGWLADHSGKRMPVVQITALLAAVSFAPFLWLDGYRALMVIMMCFGFFWSASLPQFEAVTLNHLGAHIHAYTQIRLWGSIAFIVMVILLGRVFEQHSITLLPGTLLALMVSTWLIGLITPEHAARHPPQERGPLKEVLMSTTILALFVTCVLLQVSYGPYYNFYSIYLEEHGYARTVIGGLWALGVACPSCWASTVCAGYCCSV